MKKITAFFMAILPFVVVIILFATGLIVKDVKYVDVKSIEIINDSLVYQKPTLDTAEYDFSKNIVINPSIATDPVIYYQSTNTDVLDFQGQATSTNGVATIKDYKDDVTVNCWAKAKPDDVKHFKFSCVNDKVLGIRADDLFMIANGTTNPNATTIPSTHVTSNLTYKCADEASKKIISIDEHSGQINANSEEGVANVTITNNNETDPSQIVSKDIKVYVIPYIVNVGFKDEATSVVTNSNTYNIFDQLFTQPTNVKAGDQLYFEYTSSDESIATVDENGLVTFKQAHKPVDIYINYRADSFVWNKRTLTSTMDNYVDVSFNKYTYTANMNDFSNDKEITDIKYSTYPASISGKSATITSDNPSVVKVENNKIYAVGPGTCNLTVSVNTTSSTKVEDKMSVTILPGSSTEILNTTSIDLSDNFYYCLNSAVKDAYKDKQITWTITSGDAATLDSGVLHFTKVGEVTCKAEIGSATATLKVKTSKDPAVVQLNGTDEYTTQGIKAGQKFQFVDESQNPLAPTFDETTAKLVYEADSAKHIYVANTGTQEVKSVTIGSATISFVISEDVVDIKPTSNLDLWPNYTTNSEKIEVGKQIQVYPTTATLEDGSKPTIGFEYIAEDQESLIWPIVDNTLQIIKPTSVKINAKINNINKSYSVKSYAGLNGKFTMKENGGSTIQSGKTYDLAINDTKTLVIESFQLPDVDTSSAEILKKGFKFTSLNGQDNIVHLEDIVYANNTLQFTFKALAKGEDIITISNGSFTFYVNVKIAEAKINHFDLFCNDVEVEEYATSYSKDLTLFVGIDPISATDKQYTVKANGKDIEATNNTIQLKDENWENDACTLVLTSLDGTVTQTYNLTYTNQTPTVKINEAVDVAGKKYIYSRAGVRYIAATFSANGLINKSYYQDHFSVTGEGTTSSIISNTLLITIPEPTDENPGFEGDVKVTSTTGDFEESYHISRDIVSRIELPKNDNDQLSDKKGMQKVHVYGNKSFYTKEEGNVDYYRVDINVFDYKGDLITDLTKKETAIKTLVVSTSNGSGATYDKDSGQIKYKFSSDASKIYTFDEIYENKFDDASISLTKDQIINVSTNWALHSYDLERRADVNKSYNFVVVEGTNVINQEGLQANHGDKASIVLQTNFGLEKVTKDNTPLTDWQLNRWRNIYGNGYSMNFDARTSYDKDKRPHEPGKNDFLTLGLDNVINVNMIGCNDSTFENIMKVNQHKFNSIANIGASATTHFAYCKFSNFYQVMTLWGSSTNYIKNCVYNNNGGVCLSISDEGNHTYIQDTGFFKCSNVAIILQKKAGLYLKGDIQVFNFVKNDIFKDIGGHDFSFLWTMFEPILDEMGFLQWGADGQNHINAYCIALLPDDFYFWEPVSGKYLPSKEAIKDHKSITNHLEKSLDIDVLGGVSIWTTKKPNTDPKHPDYGCPSYYQEYDKNGNIKNDELINLINRLSRQISF